MYYQGSKLNTWDVAESATSREWYEPEPGGKLLPLSCTRESVQRLFPPNSQGESSVLHQFNISSKGDAVDQVIHFRDIRDMLDEIESDAYYRPYDALLDELYEIENNLNSYQDYIRNEAVARNNRVRDELNKLYASGKGQKSNRDAASLKVLWQNQGVFNSTKTFQETLDLARWGWPEGVRRVLEAEGKAQELFRNQVQHMNISHNLMGGAVDVPAYIQGKPYHMLGRRRNPSRLRAPHIFIDINQRCDKCGRRAHDASPTPHAWVLARGVAVSMLVQMLTRAGFRPTVNVGTTAFFYKGQVFRKGHTTHKGPGWKIPQTVKRSVITTIHNPGDTFDINKLVFATAHLDMVQRLDFRIQEIENAKMCGFAAYTATDSGAAQGIDDEISPHSAGFLPRVGGVANRILIPAVQQAGFDGIDVFVPNYHQAPQLFAKLEDGIEWLLDVLRRLNVPLERG